MGDQFVEGSSRREMWKNVSDLSPRRALSASGFSINTPRNEFGKASAIALS
jgi:hypothetical protein